MKEDNWHCPSSLKAFPALLSPGCAALAHPAAELGGLPEAGKAVKGLWHLLLSMESTQYHCVMLFVEMCPNTVKFQLLCSAVLLGCM